ncbi:hypothetical protein C0Z16_17855 [Paraburkholderia rhynchosiae]|uniref:Uncharacterized protein n=2 Tax=Paraburkholderia rhynchosiae TaxID=487049 RepID=A0ABX4V2P9_9BURK|nr:hypothetical protein C0Z16_17855 [Paraburkholderia rhynchosiae]
MNGLRRIVEAVTATARESAMSDSWIGIVMGSSVLVIASMLVAGHYRREQRRRQLLRNLDHHDWWGWPRH